MAYYFDQILFQTARAAHRFLLLLHYFDTKITKSKLYNKVLYYFELHIQLVISVPK